MPELIAQWRRTDHCPPPAETRTETVTTSVATCPDGRAVELISVADAGHQWPGARPAPLAERLLKLDPPSPALDATTVIWNFFSAHPQR